MNESSENVNNSSDIFKLEWFYIDVQEKQPKGPVSVRDIDVFMRTNNIDSNTYVWKEGMSEWKKIYQLGELKDIASTTHTEIQESLIRTKIQSSFNISGQKLENNAVDNFYFGADGFWHVYSSITKTWSLQEKKPIVIKKSFDVVEEEDEYITNIEAKIDSRIENNIESTFNSEIKELCDIFVNPVSPNLTPSNENRTEPIIINQTEENNLLKRKRKAIEMTESVVSNPIEVLTEKELQKLEKKKKKSNKKKEKKKQLWYMSKVNSNVYVIDLPKDISESELNSYFSRCGFIRKDQRTNQPKIKLYKDPTGRNKGDALISFLREESVTMAVDLLNESEIRPGCKISVEKAKFEQKGEYKPRETYKLDYLQKYKLKTDVDRMLGWNEEDEEKGLRIVILKNMFEPKEFLEDEGLKQDLEMDIIEECEINYGQVERFLIFEEHPFGIIKIKFKTPMAADKCIEGLNNRYYNGKQIEAFYWDGKTDYLKYKEDISTQEKRIEEFGQWLQN